jgi:MFS family permease
MAMDADVAARRRWTLVLVNLASVLEKADEVLLPAVYREVGAALGASPTALGSLTLCRALVQTACYPLAAYASARHDRARVVAVGAFLWAAATFLVAISGTFLQVRGRRLFSPLFCSPCSPCPPVVLHLLSLTWMAHCWTVFYPVLHGTLPPTAKRSGYPNIPYFKFINCISFF